MPKVVIPMEEATNISLLPERKTDTLLLRAESIQNIISHRPTFTERWALLMFLFILTSLFVATWFIKYPDIIEANASLTAADAPKEIAVRQDGRVIRLFAGNDDSVTKGQVIAWIESSADHKEVVNLSGRLERAIELLSENKVRDISGLFAGRLVNLGELQPSYQQFLAQWQQFDDYLLNGYYQKREAILLKNANLLRKMHNSLEQQMELTQEGAKLSLETFDTVKSLYTYKVLSTQDLRDQKSKLLDKQLSIPILESSILSNENLQIDKQKEIIDLEHSFSQQKVIFLEDLQTLKSFIDDWIKKYVIRSPANGKVVFTIPVQENQYVQAGKTIGYVNPSDVRYYALVSLDQRNFGKIRAGQRVQLRFDAYPYEEFGFVSGKLQYISKVPSDSGFLADIQLPAGLTTNYNKVIQYRSGLRSRARIIISDVRLLQRFYYNLAKMIQN